MSTLFLMSELLLGPDAVGDECRLNSGHIVFANFVRYSGKLEKDSIFRVWNLNAALVPH